jgi:hypothetical protein
VLVIVLKTEFDPGLFVAALLAAPPAPTVMV